MSLRRFIEQYVSSKYTYNIEGSDTEFTISDVTHKGALIRVVVSQDQEEAAVLVGDSSSSFDFEVKTDKDREKIASFIGFILQGEVVEKRRILFSSIKVGEETHYEIDPTTWGDKEYTSYPLTAGSATRGKPINK